VTGDAAVGQEIRRVGNDSVEPAFRIFAGNGVEQFEAVAMVKPDKGCVGGENKVRLSADFAD
jgi:hypothetical protein